MNFNDYQNEAAKTAIYPTNDWENQGLNYALSGLSGEVGELHGKFSKVLRGDKPLTEDLKKDLAAELGDVLWFLACVAGHLGVTLGDVAQSNLDKLAYRAVRNVIAGDGDFR